MVENWVDAGIHSRAMDEGDHILACKCAQTIDKRFVARVVHGRSKIVSLTSIGQYARPHKQDQCLWEVGIFSRFRARTPRPFCTAREQRADDGRVDVYCISLGTQPIKNVKRLL